VEEFMKKEKRLAAEWSKKDQSAAERYEEALATERTAAQAEIEKARRELMAEKKRMEQDGRARERETKEQIAKPETHRQPLWEKTLEDYQRRLADEAEAKRHVLEKDLREKLENELARERETVREAAVREKTLREEDLDRRRRQLLSQEQVFRAEIEQARHLM